MKDNIEPIAIILVHYDCNISDFRTKKSSWLSSVFLLGENERLFTIFNNKTLRFL